MLWLVPLIAYRLFGSPSSTWEYLRRWQYGYLQGECRPKRLIGPNAGNGLNALDTGLHLRVRVGPGVGQFFGVVKRNGILLSVVIGRGMRLLGGSDGHGNE